MDKIKKIRGREILDSRGNPTVEADLIFEDGSGARASVPSGASTGSYEAVELRDNDKRYGGKGVQKAVDNINNIISKELEGKEFDQRSIDEKMIELDGTPNKENLGANAILGVSLAFAKAMAKHRMIPLYQYFFEIGQTGNPIQMPVPMMNILNGGKHAENSTDLQEFMIIPVGAKNFKEALRYGSEVFQSLKQILSKKGLATTVGDEGGFAPELADNEAALKLIVEAIEKTSFVPGVDIALGIDSAATEFYKDDKYILSRENKEFSGAEMTDFYEGLIGKYPIISLEDPLSEDDWQGYSVLNSRLGKKIQIVGDDLYVTNVERITKGIESKATNAVLIKLNQIGTVTETINAIKLAKENDMLSVVSHRSGETEDSTIADFVVGLGTGQIKTGSLCRSERICKYNQLLRIEEDLGEKAIFRGKKAF